MTTPHPLQRDGNKNNQDLAGQSLGCRQITYHILRWCASTHGVHHSAHREGNPASSDKVRHCSFVLSRHLGWTSRVGWVRPHSVLSGPLASNPTVSCLCRQYTSYVTFSHAVNTHSLLHISLHGSRMCWCASFIHMVVHVMLLSVVCPFTLCSSLCSCRCISPISASST